MLEVKSKDMQTEMKKLLTVLKEGPVQACVSLTKFALDVIKQTGNDYSKLSDMFLIDCKQRAEACVEKHQEFFTNVEQLKNSLRKAATECCEKTHEAEKEERVTSYCWKAAAFCGGVAVTVGSISVYNNYSADSESIIATIVDTVKSSNWGVRAIAFGATGIFTAIIIRSVHQAIQRDVSVLRTIFVKFTELIKHLNQADHDALKQKLMAINATEALPSTDKSFRELIIPEFRHQLTLLHEHATQLSTDLTKRIDDIKLL